MSKIQSVFRDIYSIPYQRHDRVRQDLYRSTKDSLDFVQRMKLLKKLPVHEGCVNTICWNDSGEYILSGSDDQQLCITSGNSYKLITSLRTRHRANIFSAKFLPNTGDKKIVSCSGDGLIIYTDLDRPDDSFKNCFNCHLGTAYKIATVPNDPNTFLSCGEDGTVRWFDLRIKTQCSVEDCKEDTLINCRRPVTALAVDPVLPYQLAIGCCDSSVRIYDRRMLGTRATGNFGGQSYHGLVTKFTVPEFEGKSHRITSLVYSSDSREVLVSYSSEYLYLFRIKGEDTISSGMFSSDLGQGRKKDGLVSQPPMKRLRLRGDWSDTGPNARPEREMRDTGQQRTLHANLMQHVSDVLTRMLNDPSRRNRQATPPSSNRPRNLTHSGEAVNDPPTNEATGASHANLNVQCSNSASQDLTESQMPAEQHPVNRDNAEMNSEEPMETERSLQSVVCASAVSSSASDYENHPQTSAQCKSITAENAEVPTAHLATSVTNDDLVVDNVSRMKAVDNNEGAEHLSEVADGRLVFSVNVQETPKVDSLTHVHNCLEGTETLTNPRQESVNIEKLSRPEIESDKMNTQLENGNNITVMDSNTDSRNLSEPSSSQKHNDEDDHRATRSELRIRKIGVSGPSNWVTSSESETENVEDAEDDSTSSSDAETIEPPSNLQEQRNRHRSASPFDILKSMDEAFKRQEEEREKEDKFVQHLPQPILLQKFTGHRNARTMIKEANFWGDNYVMSGSDCGHVFFWNRHTTELVMIMEADHHVVNCLQPHPYDPVLATSGIDYDVKLWGPSNEEPNFDEKLAVEIMGRNEVMLEETRDTITVPASFMIRMLASFNHLRQGGILARWRQSLHTNSTSDDE